MTSVQKMILIPFNQYKRLTSNINNEELDQGDSNDTLQKHQKDSIKKQELDIVSKPVNIELNNNKNIDDKLSETDILTHFSKALQNKAKLLLQYIIQNPELSWTKDGELIVSNNTIKKTHIIDLIKYSLISYKDFKPIGAAIFLKHLQNVPKSLLKNNDISIEKQNKEADIHLKKNEPPPGEPFIKKIRLDITKQQNNIDDKSNNWKQLWKTH